MVLELRLFTQKIDFKMCVMRLNRVELFFTFVVVIGSKGRAAYGRGAATCGLAACLRGWLPTAKPLVGAAMPPARVAARGLCRVGEAAPRLPTGVATYGPGGRA
ncbi:hypothetical protein GW17_00042743, partial [Ensete ventricosum]